MCCACYSAIQQHIPLLGEKGQSCCLQRVIVHGFRELLFMQNTATKCMDQPHIHSELQLCMPAYLRDQSCCTGNAICTYLLWDHQKPLSKVQVKKNLCGPAFERKRPLRRLHRMGQSWAGTSYPKGLLGSQPETGNGPLWTVIPATLYLSLCILGFFVRKLQVYVQTRSWDSSSKELCHIHTSVMADATWIGIGMIIAVWNHLRNQQREMSTATKAVNQTYSMHGSR